MKARDVMTKHVISIEPSAPVLRAAQLMLQNHISGLPVVNAQGQLFGIVTEGDFLRRGEIGTRKQRPRWLEFLVGPGRLATEYVRACGRKVGEIMTTDLYVVAPETPLEDVVQVMEKRRVKRVPVVENGKLAGIVSRANLMQAQVLPPKRSPPEPLTPLCGIKFSKPATKNGGRRISMSSCAMVWPASGASSPMSGSARQSS